LGNISDSTIEALVTSRRQYEFGRDKLDALPRYCLDCDVRFACHGECPKNRFDTTPDGEPGLNYLCAGYKQFFHHIEHPMQVMVELLRSNRTAAEVTEILRREQNPFLDELRHAGRNSPCPCGSGLKTKKCHGRSTTEAPLLPMPVTVGVSRPPATDRGRRARRRAG